MEPQWSVRVSQEVSGEELPSENYGAGQGESEVGILEKRRPEAEEGLGVSAG